MLQNYSLWQILLICAGVFLASVIDAIGGGGGLISLPAYLLAGLPAHNAIATNKLSSSIGTTASTYRYIRRGYSSWWLAVPAVALAIAGAHLGAKLQLAINEKYSGYILIVVLVIVAAVMLKDKDFTSDGRIDPRLKAAIVWAFSFVVGIYDGFYGPGTGTFLLMAYCKLAKMDLNEASATVKIVNLSSNVGALLTLFNAGKVIVPLGLLAAGFVKHGRGQIQSGDVRALLTPVAAERPRPATGVEYPLNGSFTSHCQQQFGALRLQLRMTGIALRGAAKGGGDRRFIHRRHAAPPAVGRCPVVRDPPSESDADARCPAVR